MVNLELVPTDALVQEIQNRCTESVQIMRFKLNTDRSDISIAVYGDTFACTGLCLTAAMRIANKEILGGRDRDDEDDDISTPEI